VFFDKNNDRINRRRATAFFFGILFLVFGVSALIIQGVFNHALIETKGVITGPAPGYGYWEYSIVKYNVDGNEYEEWVLAAEKQVGESVSIFYFKTSPQRSESPANYVLFIVSAFAISGILVMLGRVVIVHRKEVIQANRKKCIVSALSCVVILLMALFFAYLQTHDYESFAGLGGKEWRYMLMIFVVSFLVLLVNIIMWLIVLIKSWITDGFSRKPESRAE